MVGDFSTCSAPVDLRLGRQNDAVRLIRPTLASKSVYVHKTNLARGRIFVHPTQPKSFEPSSLMSLEMIIVQAHASEHSRDLVPASRHTYHGSLQEWLCLLHRSGMHTSTTMDDGPQGCFLTQETTLARNSCSSWHVLARTMPLHETGPKWRYCSSHD